MRQACASSAAAAAAVLGDFMNAKQFNDLIGNNVEAALNSNEISLPEIVGILEIAKINAERLAYNTMLMHQANEQPRILPSSTLPPPPRG